MLRNARAYTSAPALASVPFGFVLARVQVPLPSGLICKVLVHFFDNKLYRGFEPRRARGGNLAVSTSAETQRGLHERCHKGDLNR